MIDEEIFGDFCFDGQTDRANAWGALVGGLVRPAVNGSTPLILINAHSSGTAKTLLCDTISIIITGRPGALIGAPRDDAEWNKHLLALLLTGNQFVVFDNLAGKLSSPSFARAITSRIFSGRLLGLNKSIDLAVRVNWLANGNNVTLGGDMPRRTVHVNLDAKVPRPWERTGFRHPDLLAWVAAHRGGLLGALLTMVRAFWAAGKPTPKGLPTFGGFEEWTEIVGGILSYAGIDGFLKNLHQRIVESDETSLEWENFLAVWRDDLFGDRVMMVNEVTRLMYSENYESLRQALPANLVEYGDISGPSSFGRKLGWALAKIERRRFGDRHLRVERGRGTDSRSRAAGWRVVEGV
jgi:hypothetical protein